MAEPVDQQCHGRSIILFVKQGIDNEGKSLRRAETFEVFSPKAKISAGGAALVPVTQGAGHVLGGVYVFVAVYAADIAA